MSDPARICRNRSETAAVRGASELERKNGPVAPEIYQTSTFEVTLTGPGKENGRMGRVTVPRAVISGLESGHTE